MKFTTPIPVKRDDGQDVRPSILARIIDGLWRPFGAMTNEGLVTGHWIDEDGSEFTDTCVKVVIECEREELQKAIRAVRRVGQKLGQRAMYFEVGGYDGVQILHTE